MTTNTDGTTRQITYGGCGCAGGEGVTGQDEAGRQQQTTADALGRVVTVKTFYLPQQGGGVYSTTTNSYNVRDQITVTRTYQGEESGGVYREATMDYDGYGRLWHSKAPQQSGQTTYSYYPDGLTQSVKDARGVTTNFTYNARHLLAGVSYDRNGLTSVNTEKRNPSTGLPDTSGQTDVAPVPNVTYGYDEAGNRTSMTTDGGLGGGCTYSYDTLSRMRSETRTLPGLPNSYTLTYDYTAAGQLKSVTDQGAGTTFTNAYDSAARITGVTGAGYATTQPFASNVRYRAWGAAKSASYGDGTSLSLSYDGRLLLRHYGVGGVTADGDQGPRPHGSDFSYWDDGRVKFAADLFTDALTSGGHGLHDRAYSYDHVGRLKEAYSGYEANVFVGNPGTAPQGAYKQIYDYNTWGDQTARTGRFWSEDDNDSESYDSRGRNTGWEYDPDGRLVSRNEPAPDALPYVPLRQSYDAAGRLTVTTQTTSRPNPNPHITTPITTQVTSAETYDGDGVGVRQATAAATTYYLRSSALGGRIIAELDPQGSRQNSYAYAGGERVVRQQWAAGAGPQLYWQHTNTVTGDLMETDSAGAVTGKETMDPMGVNVGDTDPFVAPDAGGGGEGMTQAQMDARYAQLLPSSMGGGGQQCNLDGFQSSCPLAMGLWAIGAADIIPEGAFYHRYDDGSGVWVTPDDRLVSDINQEWRSLPFGLGGTQQKLPDPSIINDAVAHCVNELYRHYSLVNFQMSRNPGKASDDSFNGVARIKDVSTGTEASIVSDVTPLNDATLAYINQRSARGGINRDNPWWTYNIAIVSVLDKNPRPGEKRYPDLYLEPGGNYLRTQLHELGNALTIITKKYYPGDYVKPPNDLDPLHPDDGPAMEDCVGREVYASIGQKPVK